MSSDLRLVRLSSEANRGLHADGPEGTSSRNALTGHLHGLATRATDVSTGHQTPPVMPVSTSTSTVNDRPATERPADQPVNRPTARPTDQAPKDDFAKANPAAWERFMADMMGAVDLALSVETAGKDGKVDGAEWDEIFSKAKEDGQLSLIEIAGMYAGLQDMHDKGIIDDGEYQDAVKSLDTELAARYNGGAGEGLDHLAELYLERLGDDMGHDHDEATALTRRDTVHGFGGEQRNDRVHNREHIDNDQDEHDEVTLTTHGRMQQVNDDREDGAISRTRQEARRHDVSAGIATALTDIGINRRVTEISAGRRGERNRGDL